jgi:hypothetical protein
MLANMNVGHNPTLVRLYGWQDRHHFIINVTVDDRDFCSYAHRAYYTSIS